MTLDPVRFSRLKLMARSPAHYQGATVEETAALERGTAVHSLVLGGARVVGYPGAVRRGKEWDAFEAAHPDTTILTAKEFDKVNAMADAVLACPEARRVLEGRRETQIGWRVGDRHCEGTPDVVEVSYVTELKATRCSEPGRFAWQARSMAYHAQLAWYLDGEAWRRSQERNADPPPELAYVVAVESTAPYPVTVFQLTQRMLDEGRRLYRLWFERLMVCEQSDAWPPYVQGIAALDVPDDDPELDFAGVEEAA